ncbi:rod shape-determining protein MreD [Sporanaerobacter sp. PP17-6a]|jgi:rod shape-determining protein MreD|nr:rod shape-determining protein MreD [Sporanaerobacter sp. PP17-6a]
MRGRNLRWLIILCIVIFNFILQSTVIPHIAVLGVVPNTALIIVVSLAILNGKREGAVVGIIAGFLQDIFFSPVLGVNALIYFLIGYFIGIMETKIYKDSLIAPFIFISLGTVIYHLLYFIIMYFLSMNSYFYDLIRNVIIIEIIYNVILSIPLYKWLLKKFTVSSIKFGGK